MKKSLVIWSLVLGQVFVFAQDTLKVELLAESFLKQTKLPGLSIAVSKNNRLIYSKGFGHADIAKDQPMLPSTRIRTASVAKVLTATALGRLATEGALNFDEPIKSYAPYINSMYANLTVRQLAGHTSGLNHRPTGKGYQNKQYQSIRETLDLIDAPLLFEPGTDYSYSTNAFNLLASVIEGASGISYEKYMEQYVFEPLKMKHTAPENINQLTDADAKIYFFKNGKLKKDRLNNGSYKIPGAAFRSTPSDLVLLMNAYSEEGFISKDVAADMFKSNRLNNGEKTNVGIAWRLSVDAFGNQVVEHAGNWRGARTVLVYFPEEEMSISLMINAECQILIEETAHMFAQVFRGKKGKEIDKSLNHDVLLTENAKEGPVDYKGSIDLDSGRGTLKVQSDTYLKSNEIIALGSEANFAFSTFFGLLYMQMEAEGPSRGKVYAYFNRNKRNPKEEKPLLEFRSLN
jgi:CubicO group peptidase (beta-lactamase class C family)